MVRVSVVGGGLSPRLILGYRGIRLYVQFDWRLDMQRWKAYWIVRAVEVYLIRHSVDEQARELVTAIVDEFEREFGRTI